VLIFIKIKATARAVLMKPPRYTGSVGLNYSIAIFAIHNHRPGKLGETSELLLKSMKCF